MGRNLTLRVNRTARKLIRRLMHWQRPTVRDLRNCFTPLKPSWAFSIYYHFSGLETYLPAYSIASLTFRYGSNGRTLIVAGLNMANSMS